MPWSVWSRNVNDRFFTLGPVLWDKVFVNWVCFPQLPADPSRLILGSLEARSLAVPKHFLCFSELGALIFLRLTSTHCTNANVEMQTHAHRNAKTFCIEHIINYQIHVTRNLVMVKNTSPIRR